MFAVLVLQFFCRRTSWLRALPSSPPPIQHGCRHLSSSPSHLHGERPLPLPSSGCLFPQALCSDHLCSYRGSTTTIGPAVSSEGWRRPRRSAPPGSSSSLPTRCIAPPANRKLAQLKRLLLSPFPPQKQEATPTLASFAPIDLHPKWMEQTWITSSRFDPPANRSEPWP